MRKIKSKVKKQAKRQIKKYVYSVIGTWLVLGGGYLWRHPPNIPLLAQSVKDKPAELMKKAKSKLPNASSDIVQETSVLQKPLLFTGQKQFILADLDSLGRAVDAHIQLKASDEPGHNGQRRAERLTYNPVGWHNYKFDKAWLFDRGHLIGYQFSGVNDEARNLVPETSQLNKGNIAHMDTGNANGMLFYEQGLDSWLELHPNYWLDYQVTPIYENNELLPRRVRLAYVGIDSNGEYLTINLGGGRETVGNNATVVVLDNVSDNAVIDYKTGKAKQK